MGRLFQLPGTVPDFTGREGEFDLAVRRLRVSGAKIGLSAFRGMGGVGKTTLAVKVGYAVKDHFPDAQLFLDLRGTSAAPVTPTEAMMRIIRDLNPDPVSLPQNEDDLLSTYRSVLAGKRALIVLDNAKDEGQIKALASVPPPVGILVTSRSALAIDGMESFCLDVLTIEEGSTLLRKIVGEEGNDEELQEVVELCGGLPLALRVAGDFLRLHTNWTVAKYVGALKDQETRLQRLRGKTEDRDVEAVLALSARQLVAEDELLALRWEAMSVFPGDFDAHAAADVWKIHHEGGTGEGEATDELTRLLDLSLVQYDSQAERYELHELIRPIARKAFQYVETHPLQEGGIDRAREAERQYARHYRFKLAVASVLYGDGGGSVLSGLDLFDREEQNIRHAWRWAVQNKSTDEVAADVCRNLAPLGGQLLSLRLALSERIEWLEVALDISRQRKTAWSEGRALIALSAAYATMGDLDKSADLSRQYLDLAPRREGFDNVVSAMGNASIARAEAGNHDLAREGFEQVLSAAREQGNKHHVAVTLNNLGLVELDSGDGQAAVSRINEALEIYREIEDYAGAASALMNLGKAHVHLGDPEMAMGCLLQAMKIVDKLGDQDSVATVIHNIALLFWQEGMRPEAIGLMEDAVNKLERRGLPLATTARQRLVDWQRESQHGESVTTNPGDD